MNRVMIGLLGATPEAVLWRFARRYVAGGNVAEATTVVGGLNGRGMLATLDILGEHVTSPAEARADGAAYLDVLRRIRAQGLDCNISVKPTHMGLKLDRELCLEIFRGLVAEAGRLGNFVRLDMEDSTCTDDTLALYRALRQGSPAVGVVLQAYLRRSLEDAKDLAQDRANVRVCKGIYVEPEAIAFKDRDSIRQNFLDLVKVLLEGGGSVGIATHDEWIIQGAKKLVKELNVPRERYEFQMLLGVRPDLRDRLQADGERLRIYVPFGEKWRAYCLRRFRENPQLLRYVLRALLREG